MPRDPRLTSDEIKQALAAGHGAQWPIILTVPELTRMLGMRSQKTIYEWLAQGHLAGTFRKRGKHYLFWRDRVIRAIFDGPDWRRSG
jgi:hypothetical protein